MLDILFVLLLFFMVSAGAQKHEAELGIQLPSRSNNPSLEAVLNPINLDIGPDGQVTFNSSPIGISKDKDLKQLKAKLKDQIQKFGIKQPVIVTPSLRSKHARVVDVLNACSAAGVKNLSFGVASS